MQTKPTTTEGQNSTKLEAESALRGAACSLLVDSEARCRELIADETNPPWVVEAARAAVMGLEKLNAMTKATKVDSLESGSHQGSDLRPEVKADPQDTPQPRCVDQPRFVRPWDEVKRDPTATPIEREIALMHEWNLTLRELRRLEAEVAQTLNENAHLADGDNCTLIRLKRAIGWANVKCGGTAALDS